MSTATSLPALQGDIAFQANLYEDRNPTRRGLHRARRDWVEAAVAQRLRPGDRAIEVGIGCGIFSRYLASLKVEVTAVDINPAFVEGVSGISGINAVLADATHDLGLGEHNLALLTEVLEHVPRDRSLAMLKSLHATLRQDGRLILTTPQRYSTMELMARLLKLPPVLALARRLYGAADELGHINLLTSAQLRQQLAAAGFEIESEARFGFYLPVIAEFGGSAGWRLLQRVERWLDAIPGLRDLIWTQAYVLKKS